MAAPEIPRNGESEMRMAEPLAQRRASDTLASQVFKNIRADIISGRLPPNQRLRLEDLREVHAVGFSPLREALVQLHSEGLVALEKMKGFRVAPVSVAHLDDLTQVRVETEALAMAWSIERGDAAWEAEVLASFHRLSKQSRAHQVHRRGSRTIGGSSIVHFIRRCSRPAARPCLSRFAIPCSTKPSGMLRFRSALWISPATTSPSTKP